MTQNAEESEKTNFKRSYKMKWEKFNIFPIGYRIKILQHWCQHVHVLKFDFVMIKKDPIHQNMFFVGYDGNNKKKKKLIEF